MSISKWTIRNIAVIPIAILFFNSFSPLKFKFFSGITQISELKNEFYALIFFILALVVAYFLMEGFKRFIKHYSLHLKKEWYKLKEELKNAGKASIHKVDTKKKDIINFEEALNIVKTLNMGFI